jgi:hypothetical protein
MKVTSILKAKGATWQRCDRTPRSLRSYGS